MISGRVLVNSGSYHCEDIFYPPGELLIALCSQDLVGAGSILKGWLAVPWNLREPDGVTDWRRKWLSKVSLEQAGYFLGVLDPCKKVLPTLASRFCFA